MQEESCDMTEGVSGSSSISGNETASQRAALTFAAEGAAPEEGVPAGSPSIVDVPATPPAAPTRSMARRVLSVLEFVVILLVVFLLLRLVIQPYTIPSGSMEDTIMTGDMVMAEKVSYYIGAPAVGDIVTFEDPEDPSRTLIKRVIATEGQVVDLRDGELYIDGILQDEPYTQGKPSYPLSGLGGVSISYPYTVPEGEVWVMGDNRTNSQDSRYFGSVPIESVTAKAVMKYWPISELGLL